MPPSFPLLPPRLAGLADVACNLSWSWNSDARTLFRAVDEQLWKRYRYDPLRVLEKVGAERLAQCADDARFLELYDSVMRWFESEKSSDLTWYARTYPDLRRRPIAYFCAEFGIYHSVPIYSGGLGVLAGDHCKTASDLGVPLVGIGILYRSGYFDQHVRLDGWQEDMADHIDPLRTPLEPIKGPHGELFLTKVQTFGRDVCIRVWRLAVGRTSVYLLDTDFDENHPDDRALLSKLYAGGPELRLKQEWLLGVGGVRALRALGIEPAAWHANEGHVAFMLIERVRELMAAGVPRDEAVRRVRENSTFTTHTPVAAGHDIFPADQVTACAGSLWSGGGVDDATLTAFGLNPAAGHGSFHMTAAAIRLSRHVNAVSRAHQVVTRRMWAPLWPGRREKEIPVGYVTNGVHLATWMATPIVRLLEKHLGRDWGTHAADPELWARVMQLEDGELWYAHQRLKHTLLALLREEVRREFAKRSRDANQLFGSGVLLSHDALTIGFARRFATYKRATLPFEDVERLLSIVTSKTRPVQIVFAGKAHPADTAGKQVLQEVYQAARDPRFQGRIAFVEDYDLHLAHVLVQGVDLWLNLPRPPMEASGTSGMKAALNGVPQLSSADGWWEEGFDGHNGWSIGTAGDGGEPAEEDAAAAAQLYDLLDREIVPMYYDVDADGIPHRWITVMKHALSAAGARFTARRMLTEYVEDSYVPSMLGDRVPDAPPTG
ncbi:MAG: alpha-glucan family phosphorylase [Gemmatimonadales bacterium]